MPPWDRCLVHLAADDLEQAVKRAKTEGLDARGVTVAPPLLERIFSLLDRTDQDLPIVPTAGFDRATFTGDVRFDRATFTGDVRFDRATFTGDAEFRYVIFSGDAGFFGATFGGNVGFHDATFTGDAAFYRTIFNGDAVFDRATFSEKARFYGARFSRDARFVEAIFGQRADFSEAIFSRDARFDGATFRENAGFVEAIFTEDAEFNWARFSRIAEFDRATFSRAAGFDGVRFSWYAGFRGTTFTGIAVFNWARFTRNTEFGKATFSGNAGFNKATFSGNAQFDGATFSEDVGFDAVNLSGKVSFRSIRAAKRLWLALHDSSTGEHDSTVDLTAASFAAPAVVVANLEGAGSRRPKLVSLEQADTTNLTVSGLDLSDCRFLGAINLDRLRIDGPLLLRSAPGWRRARRQVLWEEGKLRGWWGRKAPNLQDGPEVDRDHRERASRLQVVYRELRKSREDAKDEPGAADFYYGEMEMRRKAARPVQRWRCVKQWRTCVERWLLTGYWAVSGYGLRASRAVAAFLIVVVVFAGLLCGWGFQAPSPSRITGVNMHSGAVTYAAAPPRPGLGAALVYSAESATVFFRGPGPEQLTEPGRAFQVCLRLLGPTLLGLAVLAVRGRIKR